MKLPTTLGEDVTGHLNDQGAAEVLDIMDRKFTSELLLNPAYLVSERLYAGGANRVQIWLSDLPPVGAVRQQIGNMYRLHKSAWTTVP